MNLLVEAADEAARALEIGRSTGNTTDLADIALLAGRCRLAAGDFDGAREAARQAEALFAQHGRTAWLPLAELIHAEADEGESVIEGLAKRVETIADRLRQCGWTTDAMTADVTAARLYAIEGDNTSARRLLRSAASRRAEGPATERATAHLAMALLHESAGRLGAARRSVGVGSAHASREPGDARRDRASGPRHHARQRARRGGCAHWRSRTADRGSCWAGSSPLAAWSRCCRVRTCPTTLSSPLLLTELREINESSRDGGLEPGDRLDLARRRSALEAAVRNRARRAHATGTAEGLDLAHRAGGARRAGARRVRQHRRRSLGGDGAERARPSPRPRADRPHPDRHRCGGVRLEPAEPGAGLARRRARPPGRRCGIRADVCRRALLPASVLDSARPVVIVPTGRLHGLPWGALPALDARPTVVAPSLFAWVVAHRGSVLSHAPDSTTLIGGPDLSAAPAELAALTRIHPARRRSRRRDLDRRSMHRRAWARSRSPTSRVTARSAATTPSSRPCGWRMVISPCTTSNAADGCPGRWCSQPATRPRRRCCGVGRSSGCRRRSSSSACRA